MGCVPAGLCSNLPPRGARGRRECNTGLLHAASPQGSSVVSISLCLAASLEGKRCCSAQEHCTECAMYFRPCGMLDATLTFFVPNNHKHTLCRDATTGRKSMVRGLNFTIAYSNSRASPPVPLSVPHLLNYAIERRSGRKPCLVCAGGFPVHWPLSLRSEVAGRKGTFRKLSGLLGVAIVKARDFRTPAHAHRYKHLNLVDAAGEQECWKR